MQSLSKGDIYVKVICEWLKHKLTQRSAITVAVNLYDYANQLEQALRDSDEYKAIKDAFAKVKENEESKKLFDEFRETQMSFQQKQMQGEEIPEEDLQKAQEQAQAIEKDENISELMNAEQKMSQVFQEINQIIVKPLDEIYAD